ncbi:MAG: PQQ-binding-like beta-propeller repeat protein [Planctomycetota bacterium]|nr:PQQ-binding-like beta-propeller repeat protein [Planctomycetota bacterium]
MLAPDPGRDAVHRCPASPAFPLTLLLLTALLSGAEVLPGASAHREAAEPKWIPPYSSDLENLVRQVEEGRASGDRSQIREAFGNLSERLIDGDPGGTTTIGGGLSIGAGQYLRSTLSLLEEPIRKEVLHEIQLRISNRISELPVPGLDAEADLRRTSMLLDLPQGVVSPDLTRQLAHAALERGDLQTWNRLVSKRWIEDPGNISVTEPVSSQAVSIATGTLLLSLHRSGEPDLSRSKDAVWKSSRGFSGAVADRSRIWIQQPDKISSIDVKTGEEIWRRVLPRRVRPSLPRTTRRPVLRQPSIVASVSDHIEAFDGLSGNLLWRVSLDEILGPQQAPQSIRALSSPCRVPGGVVVVALRSEAGRLEAFGALIEDGGTVAWVRHLGEASGSTWLALRAAPATPIEGVGTIHWSTDRGSIITFRTSDGAVEWIHELDGPSPTGLRDHLVEERATGVSLRRNGARLFASAPGSSRITILDAESGKSLGIIAANAPRCWNISADGESLLVVEESELVLWNCREGAVPGFNWHSPLPKPLTGSGSDIVPSVDGGWWIGTGDALLSIDAFGQHQTIQGLDIPAHSLQSIGDALLAAAGSEVSILTSPSEDDAQLQNWRSALIGQIDPRWLPDLAGDSPRQRALRRTVHLLLDRRDLDLSSNERMRLETALISAQSRADDRIALAWQRAVRSAELGDAAGATFICNLMLSETWRNLQSTRVHSRQGSVVSADIAFTHLLLQQDQQPGGESRIESREKRAAREAGQLDRSPPIPDGWIDLARTRPGCPTGRQARLIAAQILYQLGDLDACTHQIDLLLIREPGSDEALIGHLRRSEVLREQGRLSEAIEEILTLDRDHGDRPLTRIVDGTETRITLSDRLDELRSEISTLEESRRDHPGLPLELAWSGRLDMTQTRTTSVWPLSSIDALAADPRYLVLSTNSARMYDSSDGLMLWKTDLERDPVQIRDGILLTRRDLPSAPLVFDDSAVVLHDRNRIWRLDLENGSLIWQHRLPIDFDIPDQEIRIEQSCAGSGIVVLSSEDEQITALDVVSGEVLWNDSRDGIFLDDPEIIRDRLLIGYAIPNRVELRSVSDGMLISSIDLDREDGALASAPILLEDGFIIANERGGISRHDDDGELLWSVQMPHLISQVLISASGDQLVCELFWSSERTTLLGIDVATGTVSWQKKLSQDQRRITTLKLDGEELLVVCGDFQNRSILRFKAVLAPEAVELAEAELEWSHELAPAYDAVNLRPSGDWIVVADRMRGETVILDRATGTPLSDRQGIGAVSEHLRSLGRLHHASIIGNTLLTVSSRGAAGFRAPNSREEQIAAWNSLNDPRLWRLESDRLVEMKELELAIELLEETIRNLELDRFERAAASWLLEGADRQLARTPRPDHEIPRMQTPPLIDGSLDEPWNAATGIPIDRPRHVRGLQGPGEPLIPWQDRADLSGRVFLGWSSEGLHIGIDVDDDIVTAHERDAKRWVGDCLILVLDTLGDGGVRTRKDDQILTLAFMPPRRNNPPPQEGGEEGGGEAPPFDDDDDDDDPEGEHVVVRRPGGTGAVYELTIPWSTIAEQRGETDSVPWPGMRMRIGIAVTDDDTGNGATKYLGLTPGVVLHRDLDRIWEGCCPDLMLPVRLGR